MRRSQMAHLGSSPCVWGQVYHRSGYSAVNRIIPMRVGTRNVALNSACATEDHPHACGDKAVLTARTEPVTGSSPCVWGQDSPMQPQVRSERIIPMRVGTRLKKSRKIAVLQNQPLRFPLTFHRSFV